MDTKKSSTSRRPSVIFSGLEKAEVIKMYELGYCITEVASKFNVDRRTVITWLNESDSAIYFSRKRKLFSRSERLRIAREIESGAISITEAQAKYSIKHKSTIKSWLTTLTEISRHEPSKMSEMQTEINALPNDINELKQALADRR